jgi:5-methylcytosine-specific restriction endonuclease McrA
MKTPRKKAKDLAWKATSLYIRKKFADHLGYVSCVTCGLTKHYKELHAGHFVPQAQGDACRFIEENIHPQCYRCNVNLGGNGPEYNAYMLDMYGQEKIDELRALSKTTVKLTINDLNEIKEDFTIALHGLECQE